MTRLNLTLLYECDFWKEKIPEIRSRVKKPLAALLKEEKLPAEAVDIAVVLAYDAFVQDLNQRYRGKNKPTNILSFAEFTAIEPMAAAAKLHESVHIGDLVLAYETIAKEAIEHGKTLENHLTHLLIHGALHLLGYDHEADAEAEIMESKEITLLQKLGIANPYETR